MVMAVVCVVVDTSCGDCCVLCIPRVVPVVCCGYIVSVH